MNVTYTALDKNALLDHLETSRQTLLAAVAGLTDAQSNFKPSADALSVANTVEHLAIVEDLVAMRLEQLPTSPDTGATAFNDPDEVLLQKTMDRSQKFKTPERGAPTGKSLKESLHRLAVRRRQIVGFIETAPADFRKHTMPHPVFGLLDGHQWVIALGGHCQRHVQQI